MNWRIDRHNQLRIQVGHDIVNTDEPDTLIFTGQQTEELAEFLSAEFTQVLHGAKQ